MLFLEDYRWVVFEIIDKQYCRITVGLFLRLPVSCFQPRCQLLESGDQYLRVVG